MDHPRSIPLQRPIEAKLWNEEERLIQDWYKSILIIAKRNNGDYAIRYAQMDERTLAL